MPAAPQGLANREPTVVIKVPASRVPDIRRYLKTGKLEPTCPLILFKRKSELADPPRNAKL